MPSLTARSRRDPPARRWEVPVTARLTTTETNARGFTRAGAIVRLALCRCGAGRIRAEAPAAHTSKVARETGSFARDARLAFLGRRLPARTEASEVGDKDMGPRSFRSPSPEVLLPRKLEAGQPPPLRLYCRLRQRAPGWGWSYPRLPRLGPMRTASARFLRRPKDAGAWRETPVIAKNTRGEPLFGFTLPFRATGFRRAS